MFSADFAKVETVEAASAQAPPAPTMVGVRVQDEVTSAKVEAVQSHIRPGIGKTICEAARIPDYSLKVPESSYGAALMVPLLFIKEEDSWRDCFQVFCESYWPLAVNYAIQIGLVVCLEEVYEDAEESILDGDCDELNPFFGIICLFLHGVAVCRDMGETIDIVNIIWFHMPTVERNTQFLFDDNALGESELQLVDGGLTMMRKVAVTLFIVLPKFGICITVLIFGSLYLAVSASDADLLLNALAVVFIMDVDEIIFSFMATYRTRAAIAMVPAFSSKRAHWLSRLLQHWGSVWKFLLCAGLAVLIWFCVTSCGSAGFFEGKEIPPPRGPIPSTSSSG